MPIALKEWAVNVRALAEGEQLVAMRKGGIREEEKHFELDHEQFFLYPTFDHQRNDLVRESHHPELRRALEEGVWPDVEPPPRALLADGGIPQPERVRIRAWAEVSDHFETDDPRLVESLSPFHIWTSDYAQKRLRWKRTHPLHVLLLQGPPDPPPGHRPRQGRVPRLPLVGRDRPRPLLRGHPGDGRRGVRPRRRSDQRHLPRRAGPRLAPALPQRVSQSFPGAGVAWMHRLGRDRVAQLHG